MFTTALPNTDYSSIHNGMLGVWPEAVRLFNDAIEGRWTRTDDGLQCYRERVTKLLPKKVVTLEGTLTAWGEALEIADCRVLEALTSFTSARAEIQAGEDETWNYYGLITICESDGDIQVTLGEYWQDVSEVEARHHEQELEALTAEYARIGRAVADTACEMRKK